MKKVIFRRYLLKRLNTKISDNKKLALLHGTLRRYCPFVDRIAIALHDTKAGRLKTYLSSNRGPSPLVRYESALDDSPSLRRLLANRRSRVVNDLSVFDEGRGLHTLEIRAHGYKSSYAFPMVVNGRVAGLLFFNSRKKNSFTPRSLDVLDLFAHLITNVATAGLRTAGVMTAALQTANEMVHYRDPETGNHLERMARYSRLVAQELARTGLYRFDDEQIQTIESFAPLHDVGKLGIPDNVLLKPGSLTPKEKKIMRSHTTQGRRIIDAILHNFKLESLHRVDALRHIAEHHHEAMDGSGYPHGLKGNKIPIEARIIAVADIFDALTSVRPYKSAWTNDRAFRYLRRLSRTKLDRDCVQALLHNRHAVEEIQARFRDSQAPAPAGRPDDRR